MYTTVFIEIRELLTRNLCLDIILYGLLELPEIVHDEIECSGDSQTFICDADTDTADIRLSYKRTHYYKVR